MAGPESAGCNELSNGDSVLRNAERLCCEFAGRVFVCQKENCERPMDGAASLPVADEGACRNKAEELSEFVGILAVGEGGKSGSGDAD